MFNQLSVVLGFTAGATQLYGYWVYNTKSGKAINTGSWFMWALGGVIDLLSYFFLTHDWVKNILPAVCALAAISTFVYAVMRKRFQPLEREDWAFVGMDTVISGVWFITSTLVANLLYQVSTILSFVPMLRGLARGEDEEKPLPWLIWSIAYFLLTVSVVMRLNSIWELAFPISHFVMHALVCGIAFMKQRPAR